MTQPTDTSFPGLQGLAQIAAPGGRGLPPVESWDPPYCGEMDMVIRADGSWWHEGTRITRPRLVRLFSTILRRDEDGRTYLVTPVEKVAITVEDAPFIAVLAERALGEDGPVIAFATNLGDRVEAGPAHPIRVETDPQTLEPRPYVLVRGRLEARIARAPFYDLAAWAEERGGTLGVESHGAFFPLGPRGAHKAGEPSA